MKKRKRNLYQEIKLTLENRQGNGVDRHFSKQFIRSANGVQLYAASASASAFIRRKKIFTNSQTRLCTLKSRKKKRCSADGLDILNNRLWRSSSSWFGNFAFRRCHFLCMHLTVCKCFFLSALLRKDAFNSALCVAYVRRTIFSVRRSGMTYVSSISVEFYFYDKLEKSFRASTRKVISRGFVCSRVRVFYILVCKYVYVSTDEEI